jgi:hypothetical protein
MSDVTDKLLNELEELFRVTDEVLSEWTGDGNLQFPVLLGNIAVKMNWDEKQLRENDPFVRKYIRNHPDWYITRGAHGGIMRASEKQKKEAVKAAKEAASKQMKDAIEAKAALAAQTKTDEDSE